MFHGPPVCFTQHAARCRGSSLDTLPKVLAPLHGRSLPVTLSRALFLTGWLYMASLKRSTPTPHAPHPPPPAPPPRRCHTPAHHLSAPGWATSYPFGTHARDTLHSTLKLKPVPHCLCLMKPSVSNPTYRFSNDGMHCALRGPVWQKPPATRPAMLPRARHPPLSICLPAGLVASAGAAPRSSHASFVALSPHSLPRIPDVHGNLLTPGLALPVPLCARPASRPSVFVHLPAAHKPQGRRRGPLSAVDHPSPSVPHVSHPS